MGAVRMETGFLQSADVSLFYRKFSGVTRGLPVAIFHGANYYDSADWIDVASSMSNDREIAVWDARGFGQSQRSPCKDYSFDAHLHDAERMLDHFGWPRAVVVGHSLGGLMALLFASRLSVRAAGLVLVDHCPVDARGAAQLVTRSTDNVAKVYASVDLALADTSRRQVAPGSPEWAHFAARLEHAPGGFALKRDPDYANRIPLGAPGWRSRYPISDMWDDLSRLTHPVLIVRAALSARWRPEALEKLSREYPQIQVETVQTGHDVISEAPQELAAIIHGFLRHTEAH